MAEKGRRWPMTLNSYIEKTAFVETTDGKCYCGKIDDYEWGILVLWYTSQFVPARKQWVPVENLGDFLDLVELPFREIMRLAVKNDGKLDLVYERKKRSTGRANFLRIAEI